MAFYTYLLASGPYGTLYCGHAESLTHRVWEHKEKVREGFTARYGVHRLVWFEIHDTREAAKAQERRIKKWNRAWKIRLIEEMNPEWRDLFDEFLRGDSEPAEEWLAKLTDPQPARPREGGDLS